MVRKRKILGVSGGVPIDRAPTKLAAPPPPYDPISSSSEDDRGVTIGHQSHVSSKPWTNKEDTVLQEKVKDFIEIYRSSKSDDVKRQSKYDQVDWMAAARFCPGRTGAECKVRWESLTGLKTQPAAWTEEEDRAIARLVKENGAKRWSKFALALPGRSGKQCRERWHNHLDPNVIKSRTWTEEEEQIVLQQYCRHGSKWSAISKHLTGRTDNNIKNKWNAYFAVRIEKYLMEVLQLKKDQLRHPITGYYMIPSCKIGECVSYMRSLSQKEMKGVKRLSTSTPKAANIIGRKPSSKKPKTVARSPFNAEKRLSSWSASTFATSIQNSSSEDSEGRHDCYRLGSPRSPVAASIGKSEEDSPSSFPNSTPINAVLLEHLVESLSTLESGYVGGVYVSASERQAFIRNSNLRESGRLEDLQLLNLSYEEVLRLPKYYQDLLLSVVDEESGGKHEDISSIPKADLETEDGYEEEEQLYI